MRGAGLKPSIVEYTSAMSACAEGEEWEPAVRLLARMRGEGVSPDEVAFAAAIQACGRARAWAPAVAVHAQMLAEVRRQGEVGEWGGDGRQGVVGVQGRGTGQIGALRQGGRAGGRAGSLRVTVRSFSAVLSALYRGAGPLSETLRIHDQMRAHSITPDLQCYTVLVSACVEAGDWRRALLFWDELLSRRLRPDAVSAAAALDACLRGRQPAKGLGIVQLIWERFEARRPGRMYTRAEAAALREAHRLAREQAEARGESPPPPSPPPPPPPPPVVVPARMLKGEVPTHLGSELLTARQRTEAVREQRVGWEWGGE
jgi:pentatricopeptide repeat protein